MKKEDMMIKVNYYLIAFSFVSFLNCDWFCFDILCIYVGYDDYGKDSGKGGDRKGGDGGGKGDDGGKKD